MILELESVFQVDGARVPFDYAFSMADVAIGGEQPFVSPVHVVGEVNNRAGIVTLSATASYTYDAPCDRCAERTVRDTSVPVEHALVKALENGPDDEYIEVPDLKLDLDALVREDILLALPTKYLCKEDCKGLCPLCGQNLNKGQCSCSAPKDPRWDVLSQLLDQ